MILNSVPKVCLSQCCFDICIVQLDRLRKTLEITFIHLYKKSLGRKAPSKCLIVTDFHFISSEKKTYYVKTS